MFRLFEGEGGSVDCLAAANCAGFSNVFIYTSRFNFEAEAMNLWL